MPTPLNLGGAIAELNDMELRLLMGFLIGKYSKYPEAAFWDFVIEFFNIANKKVSG